MTFAIYSAPGAGCRVYQSSAVTLAAARERCSLLALRIREPLIIVPSNPRYGEMRWTPNQKRFD